jgi:hypothetical protein
LQDGVVTAGNNLSKLYSLIQSSGGASGDTHALLTAGQDPHGIITTLRDGVAANGNTLRKLYDLVIGVGQLVGDFDASIGTLPTTGSGEAGTIDKGDMWHITVGGTLPNGISPTPKVFTGDVLVARMAGANTGTAFYVMGNYTHQVVADNTTVGSAKLYGELNNANTDGSVTQAAVRSALNAKQSTLTGTEFKTINSESIFGTGDIALPLGDLTPLATGTVSGKMKLYSVVNSATDGTPTSSAISDALSALVTQWNTLFNGITSFTSSTFGSTVNSIAEKTTLVNTDAFSIRDSASGLLSKITFAALLANIRSTFGQWSKAQYITPVEVFSVGGNVQLDASQSGNFRIALLGNVTFPTPTNIAEGMNFVITVVQNPSTPFTVTMGGVFLSTDGTVQTVPVTLSSLCAIHCRVNSSTNITYSVVKHGLT